MSIGFKEWTLVCEALGSGTQSIILRKGGIAEGRAGFRFEHPEFLLFPTLFHEQVSKLKLPVDTLLPAPRGDGQHELRYAVRVEWTRDLSDWEVVRRLEPLHIWRPEVIQERFRYDEKQGVCLAFVRVYRLAAPLVFADSPRYGGCRSWVTIPDGDAVSWSAGEAVLDEPTHQAREAQIRALLEGVI